MPRIAVYRTALPDAFHCSLFDGKKDPRKSIEGEYLAVEEIYDAGGRLLSETRFSPAGLAVHRRESRYDSGRLLEEREEFADAGSVVVRLHEYEGSTETIRVLFGDELDEVIVRELRDDGSVASEDSTDADGGLRSATDWDTGGRVTYAESLGMAQRYAYDEAGNIVELVAEKDGIEAVERARVLEGKIVEVDIFEAGEPVGKRTYAREPRRVLMTETTHGRATATRLEEYDEAGSLALQEESIELSPGTFRRSIYRFSREPDGKPRKIEVSREDIFEGMRAARPPVSGFREFLYDGERRISETLLAGFSDDERLEEDSYYRFEYSG